MRIHSDILDYFNLRVSLKRTIPDAWFSDYSLKGSRSRKFAHEIRIRCDYKKGRRHPNSGKYGADPEWVPTYDEWGFFLACLYNLDPDMVAGPYKDRNDFHKKTHHKFSQYFALDRFG